MSEINMEMAKSVYDTVCVALDKMNINYNKHEEDLVITFGHKGRDMNHNLLVYVDAERTVIQVVEELPFRISPEKASEIASAVCYANQYLVCGKFTYDMAEVIKFKVTQIYDGSLIGPETIERMILALAVTVEQYDDKFMALNKGYLKVEDFKE